MWGKTEKPEKQNQREASILRKRLLKWISKPGYMLHKLFYVQSKLALKFNKPANTRMCTFE